MTTTEGGPVPTLAPPPKSPQVAAYTDTSPRFNPFDKSGNAQEAVVSETAQTAEMARTDSQVFTHINVVSLCFSMCIMLLYFWLFWDIFLFFHSSKSKKEIMLENL